jgi:hypothetical protein
LKSDSPEHQRRLPRFELKLPMFLDLFYRKWSDAIEMLARLTRFCKSCRPGRSSNRCFPSPS